MRDYKLLSSSLLALCGVATISLPTLCRPAQAFSLQGIKEKAPAESRIRIKKRDLRYPVAFNNDIYDYLTVRIIGAGAPGSGVIFAKNNGYYYVLTARHVVGDLLGSDVIEIFTLDGEFHDASILHQLDNIDAALLKFKSDNHYYTAYVSKKMNPRVGMYVLTQGYALASNEAKRGSLRRSTGAIISIIEGNEGGYDNLYDAVTNVGMSGGGVFTHWNTSTDGEGWKSSINHPCYGFDTPILIGIHGRGESYRGGGKSGSNMFMSIDTLVRHFASTLVSEGLTNLSKETQTNIWKDSCPLYNEVKD